MNNKQRANCIERIRLVIYRFYFVITPVFSFLCTLLCCKYELIDVLQCNAKELALSGVGIASFLFAVQSIIITIPADNPFMKIIRQEGHYFVFIHKFCRCAEIIFMLTLIPMLYITCDRVILSILMMSAYICAILLTIWAMWLLGEIIIISEKQNRH